MNGEPTLKGQYMIGLSPGMKGQLHDWPKPWHEGSTFVGQTSLRDGAPDNADPRSSEEVLILLAGRRSEQGQQGEVPRQDQEFGGHN